MITIKRIHNSKETYAVIPIDQDKDYSGTYYSTEEVRERDIKLLDWILESRWRLDPLTHNWQRTFAHQPTEVKTSAELIDQFLNDKR